MQILYISWDDMRHVGLPVLTESVDDISAGTCEAFIPVKSIDNICAPHPLNVAFYMVMKC